MNEDITVFNAILLDDFGVGPEVNGHRLTPCELNDYIRREVGPFSAETIRDESHGYQRTILKIRRVAA